MEGVKEDFEEPDYDAYATCCEFIENNRELLTDFKPAIGNVNEIENYGTLIYFDRLKKIVTAMNGMVGETHENGMIGIALSTSCRADEDFIIFPNMTRVR